MAPDSIFTKSQFIVSLGVPVVIPSAVLLAYVFRFPTAAPVLGLVLPFCLVNIWFTLLVLRKPAGTLVQTLVQTLERGLRLHVPTLQAPNFFGLSVANSLGSHSYVIG